MTPDRLVLLFFGIPVAVLSLGLRRGMRARTALLVVPVSLLIATYGIGLESVARHFRLNLPSPVAPGVGEIRTWAPFAVAAVLLGAYGAFLEEARRIKRAERESDSGGDRT